jgi:hypothetical protein
MNRFTADVRDPALPYHVTMTLRARDGWLSCEAITLRETPDGPPVTGVALRSVIVDSYVRLIREEVGGAGGAFLINKVTTRTEDTLAWEPPSEREWDALEAGQSRHKTKITTQLVAQSYREALADATTSRRATAAVAEHLHISRGHASKLISQARAEGLLGPAARGQSGEITS